jgi:hypothetical protein
MNARLQDKLKTVHERLKTQAQGSALSYVLLLVGYGILFIVRSLYYLFLKPILYRCWRLYRYFRYDDYLSWYIGYWILFIGTLLKQQGLRDKQKKQSN